MRTGSFNETDLQKVAALYSGGMTKAEIADVMSIPESEVQRMIEHAEQMEYFEYRPRLTKLLLPDVADFVSNEVLINELRRVLKESYELSLISLSITQSPLGMFTKYSESAPQNSPAYSSYREEEYASLNMAAARAADELCAKLFDGSDHTIGVNWGTSVKLTINNMRALPTQNKITVISLFGDLDFHRAHAPGLSSQNVNSNNHALQLALRMGHRAEVIPLNVPGFIPFEFTKDPKTFEAIRKFLASHASYYQIFGELPGDDPVKPRKYNGILDSDPDDVKIAKMDTIITGFGSADTYTEMSHFMQFWLDRKEIEFLLKSCQEGKVVGDIAGHLIPSVEGDSDNDLKNFLRNVNRRIPAAQPSDFADVASRHRKSQIGAGVVGVTVGARKAKILARLLSKAPCPISALAIDTHCALALLKELSLSAFNQFIAGPGQKLLKDVERWSEDSLKLIPADGDSASSG